jgi:predicted nucleic acid-binding protein
MALFLDTSVVIDLLRGADYALAVVAREPLFISPITVHEIWFGMRPSELEMTQTLFEGLTVASLGKEEASLSGRWRREYAKRGVALSFQDTLIAAGSLIHTIPLATGNVKHFPMPELRVEQWPPPPV